MRLSLLRIAGTTIWAMVALFLLVLLFAASDVAAQELPPQCREQAAVAERLGLRAGGCIDVSVKAWQSPDTGRLEWLLGAYPTGEAVRIGDPELRRRIEEAILALRERRAVCGFGGGCRFDQYLNGELEDLGLDLMLPPELEVAPEGAGSSYGGPLCVFYRPRSGQIRPARFEILVRTAAGVNGGERLCLTREARVGVRFGADDLGNVRVDSRVATDDDAQRVVTEELLRVAARGFEIARAEGVVDGVGGVKIGCPDEPGTAQVASRVEQALRAIYDLNSLDSGVSWGRFDAGLRYCAGGAGCTLAGRGAKAGGEPENGTICDGLCGGEEGPVWVLFISGLQFVRSVAIRAIPDDLDREYTRTVTGRSLHRLRKQVESELNERFVAHLSARPGHIVTRDEVECDRVKICRGVTDCGGAKSGPCTEVKSVDGLSAYPYISPDRSVAFEFAAKPHLRYEVRRRLPSERTIGFRGGIGFSPEERFGLTAGLSSHGMLRLGEDLSLDLTRGPQIAKIGFNISRQFEGGGEAGWRARSISGNLRHLRDNDQRLGNTGATGSGLRETGARAAISLGYDSFSSADRQSFEAREDGLIRTRRTLIFDAAYDLRSVDLTDQSKLLAVIGLDRSLLPVATSTRLSLLSLGLRAGVLRDYGRSGRRGIGRLSLSLESRIARGLRVLGGDFAFGRTDLTGRTELIFGPISSRDLLLRQTFGFGQATNGTPLVELFRLGGPRSVRGIEEGESVGRRLSSSQTEFGVSARTVWRVLRPATIAAGSRRDAIDFSRIYLKGFLDLATIRDPTSFGVGSGTGFIPIRFERSGNGYGFAFEMRNLSAADDGRQLNLSIGYGYSPQSRLHRSGTLFTAVILNF